jgi:hypothetical protein
VERRERFGVDEARRAKPGLAAWLGRHFKLPAKEPRRQAAKIGPFGDAPFLLSLTSDKQFS